LEIAGISQYGAGEDIAINGTEGFSKSVMPYLPFIMLKGVIQIDKGANIGFFR